MMTSTSSFSVVMLCNTSSVSPIVSGRAAFVVSSIEGLASLSNFSTLDIASSAAFAATAPALLLTNLLPPSLLLLCKLGFASLHLMAVVEATHHAAASRRRLDLQWHRRPRPKRNSPSSTWPAEFDATAPPLFLTNLPPSSFLLLWKLGFDWCLSSPLNPWPSAV